MRNTTRVSYLVDLPTHVARAALGIVPHHVPLDHVRVLRHELAHVADTPRMVLLQRHTNVHADKILDLFLLLAKYHIFHAKTTYGKPLIQFFVSTVQQRFVIEKYNVVIKDNIANLNKEWSLYSHFFYLDVFLRFVDS